MNKATGTAIGLTKRKPANRFIGWKNTFVEGAGVMVLPETGSVAGVKKTHDKPGEIKRVIRAGIKANRYIRANRVDAVQFLTEWLKPSREAAASTYDSVARVYSEDVVICEKGCASLLTRLKDHEA